MEWLILGLLAIMIAVGGIAGFFGMFTKRDTSSELSALAREVDDLKQRIQMLEKNQRNLDIDKAVAPEPMRPTASLHEPAPIMQLEPAPIHAADSNPSLFEPAPEMTLAEQDEAATTVFDMQSSDPVFVTTYEPSPIDKTFAAAKDWLFGGNTLVRSGIVLLFIGISFLLKLAVDHNLIPIELRLLAVAIGGMALLTVGWRLRDAKPQYAWALQGGGVGVLYLTIFAALKLYALIPAGFAFALLAAVAFLSAFISVKQSALPLAFLGFTGGFLAPILTSTGQGNHVGLFSYYLVLNLGIAFVAFYKSWRPLNVLGWGFTFIVGTVWGAKNYAPTLFASTEPFLIIFFLLFTAIAVLYAHRQATKASDYVDATLVFGTPLVGFSLQYALLRNSHFGLAYSALALGIFYIALAWWVLTRKRETLQFLGECFLALGIGFATLTLPLALDGRWTSAAWAAEGVGLLWVGLKQKRTFPTLAGLTLQLLGAGAFVFGWGLTGHVENSQNMFLGVAFIALSGWACGALLNAYRQHALSAFAPIFAVWGWLWWVSAGLTAINEFLPSRLFVHAALCFIAATSVLLPIIARRLQWPNLEKLSGLLLAAMPLALLADILGNHPFADLGWAVWPLAIISYAHLIAQNSIANSTWLRAPLLWMIALVGAAEWQYQLSHWVAESTVWRDIGWAIVPMLVMAATMRWQAKQSDQSQNTWLLAGCTPLAVFLIGWFMVASLNSSGNAAPLPYVPLLNPLDITLAGVLFLLLLWQRMHGQFSQQMRILAAAMGFTLLNGMLLRTLHHWAGTPFEWVSIFTNSTVQMAFTILWAITAFALMLFAHKRGQRPIWMLGAGLMGLVVAKLFLLDLAQHGSVERVVSFIGAGVMLLVMGYFAPLPPQRSQE